MPPTSSMLAVESSVVRNQKYCVSLEFSHSATVTLSSVRGQADQGRESCASYWSLHNQQKGVSMRSRGLATLLHNDMRQTPD